jgi:hypothetical protein
MQCIVCSIWSSCVLFDGQPLYTQTGEEEAKWEFGEGKRATKCVHVFMVIAIYSYCGLFVNVNNNFSLLIIILEYECCARHILYMYIYTE